MGRHSADDEDWDDDLAEDVAEQGDDTVPCPYCHHPIPEDAAHCPYCDNYISQEDDHPSSKPLWFVVGAVLCLLVAAWWILNP